MPGRRGILIDWQSMIISYIRGEGMVDDLDFALAVFGCEINGQLCMNGKCSECIIAAYFCSWDDDQMAKIWEDIDE